MPSQTTHSIHKMIAFSPTLYNFAMKQAKAKGISFQEYMRYLLVKESDTDDEEEPLYMVDEETDKEIAEAMEDLKHGRYTTCDTVEESIAFLKKLSKEP